MLDPATDVDLVAGVTSVSVANVCGCQYFSCQCLWLPVPQLPVSLAASISCQFLWLPVPQLPVPLPQLLVSADALAGVMRWHEYKCEVFEDTYHLIT